MASANVVGKTLSWKTANIILDMDIMFGTSVLSEKTSSKHNVQNEDFL